MKSGNDAQLLVLFIISALPDEVSLSELRQILLACGELDGMEIDTYIKSLCESGSIYVTGNSPANARYDAGAAPLSESYIAITPRGAELCEAFSRERLLCKGATNKALREYRRITCGISYDIRLEKADGGSKVLFEMKINGKEYFFTSLFFADSHEALAVYGRMDENPDDFYNGFMTVATGKVDFLS